MGNRHSQYSTTHTPWTHRSRRRNEKYKPRVHYGDGSFFQPEKDPYAYYTVTSSRKYDRRTGKLLRETHDPIHISPRIDERGIVTYSVEPTNPHEVRGMNMFLAVEPIQRLGSRSTGVLRRCRQLRRWLELRQASLRQSYFLALSSSPVHEQLRDRSLPSI